MADYEPIAGCGVSLEGRSSVAEGEAVAGCG